MCFFLSFFFSGFLLFRLPRQPDKVVKVDTLCGPAGGILNADEQPNTPHSLLPRPLYYFFSAFTIRRSGRKKKKSRTEKNEGADEEVGRRWSNWSRGGGQRVGFVGGWGAAVERRGEEGM